MTRLDMIALSVRRAGRPEWSTPLIAQRLISNCKWLVDVRLIGEMLMGCFSC